MIRVVDETPYIVGTILPSLVFIGMVVSGEGVEIDLFSERQVDRCAAGISPLAEVFFYAVWRREEVVCH